jgi:hypothetical protein
LCERSLPQCACSLFAGNAAVVVADMSTCKSHPISNCRHAFKATVADCSGCSTCCRGLCDCVLLLGCRNGLIEWGGYCLKLCSVRSPGLLGEAWVTFCSRVLLDAPVGCAMCGCFHASHQCVHTPVSVTTALDSKKSFLIYPGRSRPFRQCQAPATDAALSLLHRKSDSVVIPLFLQSKVPWPARHCNLCKLQLQQLRQVST